MSCLALVDNCLNQFQKTNAGLSQSIQVINNMMFSDSSEIIITQNVKMI